MLSTRSILTFQYSLTNMTIDIPWCYPATLLVLSRMSSSFLYLIVREIIETASSALFLDIYLKCGTNGKRSTRLNDKRHGFHFAIVNFLHLDMPTTLAYGVYVSQLICKTLELAFNIHTFSIVTEFWELKLLNQGFQKNRLILTFKFFFGRCQYIVEKYPVSCVQMS